jgi:hypothetical protein
LGVADAEHEESAPAASTLLISRLACSLVGSTQTITLQPGSLAQRLYGETAVTETFACNFGLNPAYRGLFQAGALRVAGTDAGGEVRVVELPGHPFFLATLYLPQVRSSAAAPHPLITGYLEAALARRGASAETATPYFECRPLSTGAFDPRAVVRSCIENGAACLLLDSDALPPAFFDLSSGVAGALLHGLSVYQMRMAGVVPDPSAYSLRFQEFVREANRGRQFRFFATRAEAIRWLATE